MTTTTAATTIHEMVKATGGKYSPVLEAIKATGLKGRMNFGGERVWTQAEAETIRAAMAK